MQTAKGSAGYASSKAALKGPKGLEICMQQWRYASIKTLLSYMDLKGPKGDGNMQAANRQGPTGNGIMQAAKRVQAAERDG